MHPIDGARPRESWAPRGNASDTWRYQAQTVDLARRALAFPVKGRFNRRSVHGRHRIFLLEDARSDRFEKDLGCVPSLDGTASSARTPLV